MTGFESKRSAAQDKLQDDADTLTIVYQRGFADGKRSAQRKPLTVTTILNMMPSTIPAEYDGELMEFARAVEAKLKERNGY
jgi:hypothetical protein